MNRLRMTAAVLLIAAAAACRGAGAPPASPEATTTEGQAGVVRPGAPGATPQVGPGTAVSAPTYTAADVAFMQGMIGHHAQALEMTALLKERTRREDMKLLALRIDVSQQDEIKMMKRWLEERGQTVPTGHEHHMGGAMMPGMLSAEQMAALAAASGAEFDRRFLEGMIQHHEGAIVMVRELFAKPGAAQEADVFAFASDVEADQLIEIRRMRAMLANAGR